MVIYGFILYLFTHLNISSNIGTYGFKDFANYYFVETGAYSGDGTKKALDSRSFKEFYSLEINEGSVYNCRLRFNNQTNVHFIQGDSKKDLWNIIKNLNKPITFWLDAHIYPGLTDGTKNCPLLEELDQIKKHHIKTHTILIDDMSCCGSIAFDYITKADLIKKIKEINPDYVIKFLDGGDLDEVKDNILYASVKYK